MPTYIYACPKCGSLVEMTRSVKEHVESKPVCVAEGCDGQQVMETQLQPPALQFKGSGWTSKGS